MSVSISSSSSSTTSGKSSSIIRIQLLFAPAPHTIVSYDLTLNSAGVPYITLATTASCTGLAGDDAAGVLSRSLGVRKFQRQAQGSHAHDVKRRVPLCVAVGSMLAVVGEGGHPIFALHLGQSAGGAAYLAVGGDSDLMLMLPKAKGGGGGNVHVMRWIAAVKLMEKTLPAQVTLCWRRER